MISTRPADEDIMIVAATSGAMSLSDNDRFKYLAARVYERGGNVEFITSDFEHHKKSFRDPVDADVFPYRVTMLHELGYQRNVSLQRIRSHQAFADELEKYLESRDVPRVIYCSVPPLAPGQVAASYCKRHGVRLIVDVQDLWPESFVPYAKKIPFGMAAVDVISKRADAVYAAADEIFAVSETYAKRAARVNGEAKATSIYLGTDLSGIDLDKEPSLRKNPDELWLAYIGNLGNSYDFESVFKALGILDAQGIDDIRFVLIGDGDRMSDCRALAQQYHPKTTFVGRLGYEDMMATLRQAELAVNPIKRGTANSIVNKVGDYAAVGIPVINTQDKAEYRKIVDRYEIGLNTLPEEPASIAMAIRRLHDDPPLRARMGRNNQMLYGRLFDRSMTYGPLVDSLLGENA